jgi:hypothetical protein
MLAGLIKHGQGVLMKPAKHLNSRPGYPRGRIHEPWPVRVLSYRK